MIGPAEEEELTERLGEQCHHYRHCGRTLRADFCLSAVEILRLPRK